VEVVEEFVRDKELCRYFQKSGESLANIGESKLRQSYPNQQVEHLPPDPTAPCRPKEKLPKRNPVVIKQQRLEQARAKGKRKPLTIGTKGAATVVN
jgi:hypothetical protein